MTITARTILIHILLAGSANFLAAQKIPTESVRPPVSHSVAQAAQGLLGWQVGLQAAAFKGLSFTEAAIKTDAAGLGSIEAFSRDLDPKLRPQELDAIRAKLAALRMTVIYHAARLGPNDAGALQFARSLGASLVIARVSPADVVAVDNLANAAGVNVAIDSRQNVAGLSSAVDKASPHIGIATTASAVNPRIMDRLMALEVRPDQPDLSRILLDIAKHEPRPAEHPDACSNCDRPHGGAKPLFIALDTANEAGVEQFERALLTAMGYRADLISKIIPITPVDKVPAEDRRKIEAAIPNGLQVKPKKTRKLLVIDLCPAGGYYHTTIAFENLALQAMARKTGAFEPIFDNNLDNLKYPAIKKYDAVFLNSVVGEVFDDPAVLDGLVRFVREGGGVAGVHGSTYASMDLPKYSELMGAADGPHKVEQATLKIDDPASPLTRQFHGKDFTRSDEFYHFLPTGPFSRDKLHVLISIDASKTDLSSWKVRPDNDYGSVWIKSYGKGRVFNCAMGHTPSFYETPELEELMLNAIQFVLGDLPADTTPSARLSAHR